MPSVMVAIWLTLGIAVAATVLLISGRVRGDVVGLLVAAALALSGIIPAKEVLRGLGNPVIVVLIAVFVLTKGLELTGVTDILGRTLTRWAGGSEKRLLTTTFGMAALLSLFMNTIAAAAVLLPPVAALARRDPRFSLRKVLIPLAYGTLLGGTATLLTTANLVTSAALEAHGYAPYGVLDFLPVGLPLVFVGGLFMVWVVPHLLPNGDGGEEEPGPHRWTLHDLGSVYPLDEGLHLLRLREGSSLVGRPARRPGLARELGWTPVALLRDERAYPTARIPRGWRLRPGDIWLVGGRVSPEALEAYGLEAVSLDEPLPLIHEQAALVEVTLNPHGGAVGKTPQELRLRRDYGVLVLMVWRQGQVFMNRVHHLPLQAGDALLLHGPPGNLQRLLDEKEEFALLAQVGLRPSRNRAKAAAAIAAMLIALLPAVLGWMPLALSALLGMLWAMLTGVIHPDQAYQNVSWSVIFLVAGMIPLAKAMQSTGAAALVSEAMLRPLGPHAPAWAVAAVFLVLTVALTQIISGQAAALILAPLAIAAAEHHGLDPRGLAMAVAVGASLAFLLPTAHPANLLVMGPGHYQPRDYLRVGLPLTLVLLPVALLALQWVWL